MYRAGMYLLHTERVERLIYMNVDTPGNEFSSEITYLHVGKIRSLHVVLCRVACVVVPTTKWVKSAERRSESRSPT